MQCRASPPKGCSCAERQLCSYVQSACLGGLLQSSRHQASHDELMGALADVEPGAQLFLRSLRCATLPLRGETRVRRVNHAVCHSASSWPRVTAQDIRGASDHSTRRWLALTYDPPGRPHVLHLFVPWEQVALHFRSQTSLAPKHRLSNPHCFRKISQSQHAAHEGLTFSSSASSDSQDSRGRVPWVPFFEKFSFSGFFEDQSLVLVLFLLATSYHSLSSAMALKPYFCTAILFPPPLRSRSCDNNKKA